MRLAGGLNEIWHYNTGQLEAGNFVKFNILIIIIKDDKVIQYMPASKQNI